MEYSQRREWRCTNHQLCQTSVSISTACQADIYEIVRLSCHEGHHMCKTCQPDMPQCMHTAHIDVWRWLKAESWHCRVTALRILMDWSDKQFMLDWFYCTRHIPPAPSPPASALPTASICCRFRCCSSWTNSTTSSTTWLLAPRFKPPDSCGLGHQLLGLTTYCAVRCRSWYVAGGGEVAAR